jgi:putative ABC transport system substrate-binding protein
MWRRAAKAATATIPIVFVAGDLDPVASGLVKSLNRPGANITGITPATSFLGPKRLELLHDMIPNATSIGMLLNPNFADAETQLREAEDAARTLGMRLTTLKAGSEVELDTAFASFSQQQTSALLVANERYSSAAVISLPHSRRATRYPRSIHIENTALQEA